MSNTKKKLRLFYKGRDVAANLYSRLIHHESIIVELKAQALNYLKAT